MSNVGLGWNSVLEMPLQSPVLAQVNFGGNPAAFLGIALAVAGAALFLMRNYRPQLARDYDIAFAAIALLCGAILLFQGWRLDPLLVFGQYLLAGSAAFFAFQNIRLRGVTTEQAKRFSGPVVDDERSVSRVYRAELDDFPPLDEDRMNTRRIRGSRERYSQAEEYAEENRRASGSRSGRPELSDRIRRRRPSDSSRSERRLMDSSYSDRPPERSSDAYDAYSGDRNESRNVWDDTRSDNSEATRPSSSDTSRPRRPRSPSRREPSERPSDYTDYQPMDYPNPNANSSSEWD
jgi:hypothetical protein